MRASVILERPNFYSNWYLCVSAVKKNGRYVRRKMQAVLP